MPNFRNRGFFFIVQDKLAQINLFQFVRSSHLFLFLDNNRVLLDLDHEFLSLVGGLDEQRLQADQVGLHHRHLARRKVQLL